jgi:Protein chain release factor A
MSGDVEIAAIADDEIPDLEKRVADLEREVQIALLPPDENEDRDAIVEIRAERAEVKRPFSRPIFTGCTIAMRNLPV